MSDESQLPERLRQRLLEPNFANLVNWVGLEVSLYGGHRRFAKVALKYPDELLAAALLQENEIYCGELAAFFGEKEAVTALTARVMNSGNVLAWKALARSRPELAEAIQQELIRIALEESESQDPTHRNMARDLTVGFFESFLREVRNTNPVPVQHLFVARTNDYEGELVDMTIHMPDRVNLFATISLLLLKGKAKTADSLVRLCAKRPEAVDLLQKCLLGISCMPDRFVAVCAAIPAMDLDVLEEFALQHWDNRDQQLFCARVKRERGPLRDWLAVEYVMES